MAKRKRATRSGTAGRTARPASKQGAGKRAAGRSKSTKAAAPTRAPQGPTGRGAAQPGGRRVVELFSPAAEDEESSSALPSSLDFDQRPSAARSGRAGLEERYREHHETSPGLTAGDEDADWVSAYSVGDEAPGGDNPTPGQNIVEDVGHALGVDYADGEELKAADKVGNRDRQRWELDPASSEDYPERTKGGRGLKR
jgi:hypothetical protein